MKMTHQQIEELNNLLVDHSECLTAFYDEGIDFGFKKGAGIIALGSLIACLATTGVIVLKKRLKPSKEKES